MAFCARWPRWSIGVLLTTLSSSLACGGGAFDAKEGTSGTGASSGAGSTAGSAAVDSGLLASGGYRVSGTGGATSGGGHGLGGTSAAGGAGGVPATGGSAGPAGPGTGGAPTGTIQLVTAYDRACVTDGDCVGVVEGDVCGCPGCQGAAIARSAQAAWDADRKRIYCPAYGAPTSCPEILCIQMQPACASGLCVARRTHVIDASQYDATCRSDADCKLIYTGEVCSPCRCGTAAVNTGAYAQYEKDIAGDHCTPGPSPCDCAPRTGASCKLPATMGLGICVVGP